MVIKLSAPRVAAAALMLAGAGAGALPVPAAAQDDARMRRIEAEIRALQRVVFPNGGESRFFTPEVTPGAQQPPQTPGTPSSTALSDVLIRLDAIEAQVARLTAATEENANTLTQLESRFEELEQAQAALSAAQPAAPAAGPSGFVPLPSGSASPPAPAAARAAPAPAPAAAAPSPARVAAVRAIAKPQTDDAGDDEYSYGFRLWEAGFYPEARQQLALFLEKYPNHPRATYGRNLLGRAYLDDGQPREAAKYFFDNYQANKQAERAPDSLLFLAEAMIGIADNNRACIALAEFADTYPALATGRLKEQYDRTRNKVRCT